jgi:hypothetical protein
MKYTTAIIALLGSSQALKTEKHKKHKFAAGYGDLEEHGQALKLKGNTLENVNVIQTKSNNKWA